MSRRVRSVLYGLPVLALGLSTHAADGAIDPRDDRPRLEISRLSRPPTLEDFLNMRPPEDLEGELCHAEGFVQQEPEDGAPASQRTVVYLGYDEKQLYVIFVAFDDEPDKIRAHISRRENPFPDDIVEVQLDTFRDQRRAYTFLTNPYGIQWDAIYSETGGAGGGSQSNFDSSWDAVWHSRGRLTPQGYVVWMAIPFKSLRFSRKEEQTWGIVFVREIPRNDENSFWPRVTNRIEGRLNQGGTLSGLHGVSPGRNNQIIPYATSRRFRLLNADDAKFERDSFDPDAGVDAKLVFQDRLALDLTANPDFSQVESDLPQITVNQRFEVEFPEKRPFFLENGDFFRTPINLLFTRRIADPSGGARMTGKIGKYSFGALVVDDEAAGESVAPDNPLFDELNGKQAWFGTLRVARDVSRQSRIGLLYTDREFGEGYNRVGGIDGHIKLNDNWITTFQAVYASTRTVEGERLEGPAYDLMVNREGRKYTSHHHYRNIGRGFRTETGFVPRVNLRDVHTSQGYTFRPEGSKLISWKPELYVQQISDQEGVRLDWWVNPKLEWEFRRQTRFELSGRFGESRLRPEDLDEIVEASDPEAPPAFVDALDFNVHDLGISFSSSFIDPVNLQVTLHDGRTINFVPPEDHEPTAADESRGDVELTLRPGSRARVLATYIFTRLTDRATDRRILTNQIYRARFDWQFDPRLSLRTILQYDRTATDPSLTRLETSKNFNVDLLATYLINPWTAVFVGYNTNHQNLDRVAGPSGDEVVRTDDDLMNDARQFFVKFSYLIKL